MYREFARHIRLFPFFIPLIDTSCFFVQWVPQSKRLGLNVLFLARRHLPLPEHSRTRVIGTRLRARRSRSWGSTRRASMLCLEIMHNVSMLRLAREWAFCTTRRLFYYLMSGKRCCYRL